MKLLVTGASGFIGRNLLLGIPADWRVVATYHRDGAFPEFVRGRRLAHVTPLRVDLGDAAAVTRDLAATYDACVHLAANGDPAYSVQAPLEDLRANAEALLNVVCAATFGHFVLFSSGAVYDGLRGPVGPECALCPTLPYAISKWAAERYVMHAQQRGRIRVASNVRFFGAYGPYEAPRKIYGRLVRQFAFERSPRFTIRGDGHNLIDAMYVDDTIAALRALLARPGESRTLDLCSGKPLSLAALVREAARTFGLEAQIEFAGEVPEYIEFHSTDRTMSVDYGFTPFVELSEGLTRFRDWMSREQALAPATNAG